jgi:hypothetical protein
VSTRPGYSPRVSGGPTVRVLPWTEEERLRFLHLWAEHIDRASIQALRSSPSYDRLTENLSTPLVASFCAHIASERPESLRSRSDVFRAILDYTLHSWRRACPAEERGDVRTPQEILALLQPLALGAARGERTIVTGAELRHAIHRTEDFAQPTEDLLKGRFGLLTAVEGGYVFTIRGLAEYLAGRALLAIGSEAVARAAQEGWGVEPVRHAIVLRHTADPNDSRALIVRLVRDEAEDDIGFVNGHLRPVMIAVLAASDLGDELPNDLTSTLADAVIRRVVEETTSWVGDAMIGVVRSFIRSKHHLATLIRTRMVEVASDHAGQRAAWYESAEPQCLCSLLQGLMERDPDVRVAVCRRLRSHVDNPTVQRALWSELFDVQSRQRSMPSVEAGLTLRVARRTPEFEPLRDRMAALARTGGQMTSFSAALALHPGEAPLDVLVRGLFNGRRAGYYFADIINAIASSPEGITTLNRDWPDWQTAPQSAPKTTPPSTPRQSPPPSWSTRCRIAEGLASGLDLLSPTQLTELLSHGDVAHCLAHEALSFPERSWQVVLPALLSYDLCRRGRAALNELGRRSDAAAAIIYRVLDEQMARPSESVRYFPGRALEGLVRRGDRSAVNLYCKWFAMSPYSDSEHVDDGNVPAEIIGVEEVGAACRGVLSRLSGTPTYTWPASLLRRFSPVWQDDDSIWESVEGVLASWGTNLSMFLEMTWDVQLRPNVELRLVTVLGEFLTRHGAEAQHPSEPHYWHEAARRVIDYIFHKRYPAALVPVLERFTGLTSVPVCNTVALQASIVMVPLLSPTDRRSLSEARARYFATHPESMSGFPQHETRAFIGAAVDAWFEALTVLVARLRTEPGLSVALKGLLNVLPATQQRIAAALWRDQVHNQELPWVETRWPDGYSRLADDARRLLFESGARLDTRIEYFVRMCSEATAIPSDAGVSDAHHERGADL